MEEGNNALKKVKVKKEKHNRVIISDIKEEVDLTVYGTNRHEIIASRQQQERGRGGCCWYLFALAESYEFVCKYSVSCLLLARKQKFSSIILSSNP